MCRKIHFVSWSLFSAVWRKVGVRTRCDRILLPEEGDVLSHAEVSSK